MDPDETLRVMLEHMAEGERDGALDALDILRDWLMGGGFLPEKAAAETVAGMRREAIKCILEEVREKLDEVDRLVERRGS